MQNFPELHNLAGLFQYSAEIELLPVDDYTDDLLAPERGLVGSMGKSRRRGFSSGRKAARRALGRLGVMDFPLLIGENRAAIWPSGIRGSLSHCPDLCVAAVTKAPEVVGLGIDVESRQTLESGVRQHVLTEKELSFLADLPVEEHWDCLMFSIKESLFKCLHPVTGKWIDFQQAELALDPAIGAWSVELAPDLGFVPTDASAVGGRFLRTETHIFTSALLAPPVAPESE